MTTSTRLRLLISLFLSLLLSACASLTDLKAAMQAAPVCCKSFTEFKYLPLDAAATTDLALGQNSPAFVFDGGKSYFQAYSLPARSSARKLRVRSFITGASALETKTLSQVYCPKVSFLDAKYQVVASSYDVPRWARGALATGIFPSFVADFEVPASAAYVVLHTDPAGFGTLVTRYTGAGAYLVGSHVVVERGGEPIHHPCGPVARAELSLM
ncbi:MAG: hypothetical protein ACK4VX_14575 [Polaromonas sp.]